MKFLVYRTSAIDYSVDPDCEGAEQVEFEDGITRTGWVITLDSLDELARIIDTHGEVIIGPRSEYQAPADYSLEIYDGYH